MYISLVEIEIKKKLATVKGKAKIRFGMASKKLKHAIKSDKFKKIKSMIRNKVAEVYGDM